MVNKSDLERKYSDEAEDRAQEIVRISKAEKEESAHRKFEYNRQRDFSNVLDQQQLPEYYGENKLMRVPV